MFPSRHWEHLKWFSAWLFQLFGSVWYFSNNLDIHETMCLLNLQDHTELGRTAHVLENKIRIQNDSEELEKKLEKRACSSRWTSPGCYTLPRVINSINTGRETGRWMAAPFEVKVHLNEKNHVTIEKIRILLASLSKGISCKSQEL